MCQVSRILLGSSLCKKINLLSHIHYLFTEKKKIHIQQFGKIKSLIFSAQTLDLGSTVPGSHRALQEPSPGAGGGETQAGAFSVSIFRQFHAVGKML